MSGNVVPFDGGLGQIQSAMDRLLKVTRLLNVISVDDLLERDSFRRNHIRR